METMVTTTKVLPAGLQIKSGDFLLCEYWRACLSGRVFLVIVMDQRVGPTLTLILALITVLRLLPLIIYRCRRS